MMLFLNTKFTEEIYISGLYSHLTKSHFFVISMYFRRYEIYLKIYISNLLYKNDINF